MNRYRHLGFLFLIASMSVFAFRSMGPSTPRSDASVEKKVDELAERIDALRALLADVKKGQEDAEPRLEAWLDKHLVPGITTLEQTQRMFGTHFVNLDRPDRDDIVTLQYSLEDAAGKRLVLDFAAKTSMPPGARLMGLTDGTFDPPSKRCGKVSEWDMILRDFGTHIRFCGFCPHILVSSGGWRLDGKMLPGAIGPERETTDTLLLPRARAEAGAVSIRLANWAPETEFLDQVELGVVHSEPGEQVDVDARGVPYRWREQSVIELAKPAVGAELDAWRLDVPTDSNVLVLELRNTQAFQDAACAALKHRPESLPNPKLVVETQGQETRIGVLGTKLLRRVVVPLPPGSTEVRLRSERVMWWVRRAWFGTGATAATTWIAPHDAPAELYRRDGRRLCLHEGEEREVRFDVPDVALEGPMHYVLRLRGYYEIDPAEIARLK